MTAPSPIRHASSMTNRLAPAVAEEVSAMGASALGREARRALQEGDYGDERWQRYAARATELVMDRMFIMFLIGFTWFHSF